MKIKVNWKELGKMLWAAVKPVFLAAIGGGVVALSGCSSMTPSTKAQTMSVYAFGIPGIAVITSSNQDAAYDGNDTNAAVQSNPADVEATAVKR